MGSGKRNGKAVHSHQFRTDNIDRPQRNGNSADNSRTIPLYYLKWLRLQRHQYSLLPETVLRRLHLDLLQGRSLFEAVLSEEQLVYL